MTIFSNYANSEFMGRKGTAASTATKQATLVYLNIWSTCEYCLDAGLVSCLQVKTITIVAQSGQYGRNG